MVGDRQFTGEHVAPTTNNKPFAQHRHSDLWWPSKVHQLVTMTGARNNREKVKGENPDITKRCEVNNNCLYKEFSLYEPKRAIMSVKETSHGKDEICYSMLGKLLDVALASSVGESYF